MLLENKAVIFRPHRGSLSAVMDDGTVIQEHDLFSLTADHVRMFQSLLEVIDFVDS